MDYTSVTFISNILTLKYSKLKYCVPRIRKFVAFYIRVEFWYVVDDVFHAECSKLPSVVDWWYLEFRVCIMAITRAGAIAASSKGSVKVSRE